MVTDSGCVTVKVDGLLAFLQLNRPPANAYSLDFLKDPEAGIEERPGRILERFGSIVLVTAEDTREGVRAFHERRAPRWSGR